MTLISNIYLLCKYVMLISNNTRCNIRRCHHLFSLSPFPSHAHTGHAHTGNEVNPSFWNNVECFDRLLLFPRSDLRQGGEMDWSVRKEWGSKHQQKSNRRRDSRAKTVRDLELLILTHGYSVSETPGSDVFIIVQPRDTLMTDQYRNTG